MISFYWSFKNNRFETTNSWIVWHIMTFFLRWVHTLLLTLRNFIIHPNPNSCSAQPQADPTQCTNVHARWQSASQEVIYQTIWCTLPARVDKRDRQGPWKESTTPSQADMIWAIFSRCLFGVIPFLATEVQYRHNAMGMFLSNGEWLEWDCHFWGLLCGIKSGRETCLHILSRNEIVYSAVQLGENIHLCFVDSNQQSLAVLEGEWPIWSDLYVFSDFAIWMQRPVQPCLFQTQEWHHVYPGKWCGVPARWLGDLAFETARSYRIAAEQLLRRILKPPILSSRPQGTNIHQNISGVIGQVGQVLRSTEWETEVCGFRCWWVKSHCL